MSSKIQIPVLAKAGQERNLPRLFKFAVTATVTVY
jgi:hypothetical protein